MKVAVVDYNSGNLASASRCSLPHPALGWPRR